MKPNTPRVPGTEAPSWWDLLELRGQRFLQQLLGEKGQDRINAFFDFILVHYVTILSIIAGLLILWLIITRLRRKQRQIIELWQWILFFLTKRQMMIPLIITLAKRKNMMIPSTQKLLLQIRKESRLTSLKKHPQQRLLVEKKISQALQDFFSKAEYAQMLSRDPRLIQIAEDLQFFDTKLIQLQSLYSDNTQRWNKSFMFPVFGIFLRIFGIKKLTPFI